MFTSQVVYQLLLKNNSTKFKGLINKCTNKINF